MIAPKNILAIVDPTAGEHPAVQKAAELARRFTARLELYICDTKAAREIRLLAERAADPNRLLTVNLKPMLESLAKPLRETGLDVSTDCGYADSLVHGLLDRLSRTGADLVVKDTHHHSLLRRTLLTNTDWQLIRDCPRPLLLVKAKAWSSAPVVVAAVDPGHLNDKPVLLDRGILDWGQTFARHLRGTLHAVHVYVPLTIAATSAGVVAPMANVLTAEAMEFEDREKRKELHALTDPFEIDRDRLHLDLGVPSDMLPRKASDLDADLMVMGAIARSGLAKVFVGSTAERVLEALPCDALIVKPENFVGK